MARPLRIDFPRAWHHVMNRGARHQDIFLTDDDRQDFLSLLAVVHERFEIEINAHCLMGNHYHLLIKTPSDDLSRAMHYLDGVYAQRFNRRNGFDGPLFRGRFLSKLVDTDGYCHLAARYIHRNPLEAGIVDELLDYPWSSYPSFMGATSEFPDWLYTEALELGGLRTRDKLREATEDPLETSSAELFKGSDAAVGSKEFVAAALATTEANHETHGHVVRCKPKVDPLTIERTIADHFEQPRDQQFSGTQGVPNRARLIAVGLAQQLAGMTLQEIADRYGYTTPMSAGSATARFRKEMRSQEFAIVVEQIIIRCRQGKSEARPHSGGGQK